MERNPRNNRCHTFKAKLGPIQLNFNPVVTVLSAFVIWGFVTWCVSDPNGAYNDMGKIKKWITATFTWFYIGAINVLIIFLIYLYFSKYSDLKLGKDDEKPEFSDATYFTMLFAAGIGIGLFYFSVSEPISHYEPGKPNRYWGRHSDNQRAQDAINLTLFHWGLHGWVVYSITGLLMSVVTYRKGLPMTIRSCFYPLVGDRIFGFFGDVIDIFSVVSTMFGVCTSLGFGVMSLNTGLNRLNSNISETVTNQIIIIWGVTIVATISVVSGLKVGIRRLSELCFCLGMFLMLFVFFHDDSWFILNLYVQSIGYYLHSLLQLGFHTEAFAQLGNAPDGRESPEWMDGWTVFYWGWWVAFCPFVGMFIAKISRGRTIKNFLNATLTAPVIYIFMWFCIFGGAGLKMERDAVNAGANCSVSPYVVVDNNKLYKLSCQSSTDRFFDMLQQYGDNLGFVLNVITVISILLYFVTSSDSGSLVIDCLSANGNPEPPVAQRIFWALTEGACATALLKGGGKDALTALQTVSIAAGLPYLAILLFMCVSIWQCVKEEAGDVDPNAETFAVSLFDVFDHPSFTGLKRIATAVVAPWWPAGRAAGKLYNKSPLPHMLVMAILFYGWILFEILQVVESGLAYVGWVVLCGFWAYVVGIRSSMREECNIPGSMASDAFTTIFYFLAVDQMDKHMSIGQQQKKEDPDLPLEKKSGDVIMENAEAKVSESTTFV
ncbi:uncharacterized protein LOC114536170 [Dendronephthya gigantea]|uniref:uncharacterized protein LOC114536170 n=1 Tax=Dendronephthya gigantea TaxID=151771 RepID=UPI00106D14E2|nr:uncharacterized protein LOC114536170 [Dendronephthya gigantea]